jgi:hypothetical protein
MAHNATVSAKPKALPPRYVARSSSAILTILNMNPSRNLKLTLRNAAAVAQYATLVGVTPEESHLTPFVL